MKKASIVVSALVAAAVVALSLYPSLASVDARIAILNAYASLWARIQPPEIVMVGDSLTKGNGAWFLRLRESPLRVQTFANAGLMTAQLAPAVERAVAMRPRVICYMSGSNDIGYGADLRGETLPAYRRNLETLTGSGARIIVTLAPPTVRADDNLRLQALNGQIRRLAEQSGALVIDLWPDFAGPDGLIRAELTSDGTHLTANAYAVWGRRLREALNG